MKQSDWPVIVAISVLILSVISSHTADASYALPSADIPGIPPDTSNSTNVEYCKLLAYSLYFYEAQRSGKLPPNNRVSWRQDSALEDGNDVGLDLTGGYYDAGDYVKFTFPLSWSLTSVSWGALEWFQGYEAANQTEYLRAMLRWGTDWLIKAHPAENVLYAQVGESDIDNDYWGPDTGIPYPRPASANSAAHGTDSASSAAAALAAASVVFRQNYNDTSYADLLVSHAVALYAFAELQPFTKYSDSIPDSKAFYGSSRFSDDLVWGALWLYHATGNLTYFTKATNYIDQFSLIGSESAIINWDDKMGAAFILLVKFSQQAGQDPTKWQQVTEITWMQ